MDLWAAMEQHLRVLDEGRSLLWTPQTGFLLLTTPANAMMRVLRPADEKKRQERL
jgi:hypothetical protein